MNDLNIAYACNKNGFVYLSTYKNIIVIRHINTNFITGVHHKRFTNILELENYLNDLNTFYNGYSSI